MREDGEDRITVPAEVRDALERAAEGIFVGRVRERAQLDTALIEALGGRGRIFLIAGEPGIGKTRLAEHIAADATQRGASVLWGRCWEGEGAPAFWPWVQVIRSYMRGCDAPTLAAQLGLGAPYVAQVVPELRERLPDVPAAPPLDSEQARFRLYDSFAALLRNAAARAPLVLVLDDLQWADKSSLLLLQFLAREIGDARLLVLGTYRDVEVSRGSPLAEVLPALRRERTVDRTLLRGLPADDVRVMLAALGGAEVPEAFAAEVASETGGNPFFIKEIGRHLLDEGIAYREGDRWVGRVAPDEIRLPESVREVIGRRLARLGNPCTKLLTLAAVIGHEFGLDVLERAGELQREPLIEALEEAVSARVIEEVPQAHSAGLRTAISRYRFSHTLIRETLYQELRTLERVRLHGRVGAALERLFAQDPEPHLAEIAHHFLESLPSGEVAKAVEYAVRAGDRASERLAYQEAAILYGRALQALELLEPADARVRCELLLKVGDAQWNAGGFEPANVFREAAELAEKLGAPELLARAALGIGGPGVGFSMIGAQDEVEADFLARALAALDETDTALRARVMGRMSGHSAFGRGPGEALVMGRQAVEMARRIGDSQTLGYVLNSTPWATWTIDNLEERLALAEEALRLAEAVGDRRLATEACLWRATHHLEIGNADAVDRDAEAQMRFAATSRQPYLRYLAATVRAGRAFLDGRFEEVERYRSEARAAATEAWGSHAAVLIWADGSAPPFESSRGQPATRRSPPGRGFWRETPCPSTGAVSPGCVCNEAGSKRRAGTSSCSPHTTSPTSRATSSGSGWWEV